MTNGSNLDRNYSKQSAYSSIGYDKKDRIFDERFDTEYISETVYEVKEKKDNFVKTKYDNKVKILKEEHEQKLSELDVVMLNQEKEIEKQRNRVLELEEKLRGVESIEDFQKNIEVASSNITNSY